MLLCKTEQTSQKLNIQNTKTTSSNWVLQFINTGISFPAKLEFSLDALAEFDVLSQMENEHKTLEDLQHHLYTE